MRQTQQPTGLAHDPRLVEPSGSRSRVLVIRSCRRVQFAAAVATARQRHPRAEIVALTHAGHHDSLRAAGVDRILEIPGRRFGLLRMTPASVLHLRRERFDEIVIPQMTAEPADHGNLYRLAAALRAREVTVIPGGAPVETFAAAAFRRNLLRQLRRDVVALTERPVLVLALLVAAWWRPRHEPEIGERLRVLHIISSLGVGGAQRQLAELIDLTPADRYDVDVLVLGRTDRELSRPWFGQDRVTVTYVDEWPRLVSSVLEVRRRCRNSRYDVVHTWLFMANIVGVAAARLAGVPRVIASVRGSSLWNAGRGLPWWFRIADAICARAADVVTVNAQALAVDHGKWAWYPAHRIEVVHNGLQPSSFVHDAREAGARLRLAAGVTEDRVIVGTVGRLVPEKDHLTFLRVIQRVRQHRSEVHGVIVGDGQLRNQLESAAADLGLADNVTFLGECDDARRLMAGFDVFLLTSAVEGFPNVLLEAAFLGVPAVASRVGGSPDILADIEETFIAGDVGAAARRVVTVIEAPSVAAERAKLTRQRALRLFTADRTARRWFALYRHEDSKSANPTATFKDPGALHDRRSYPKESLQ